MFLICNVDRRVYDEAGCLSTHLMACSLYKQQRYSDGEDCDISTHAHTCEFQLDLQHSYDFQGFAIAADSPCVLDLGKPEIHSLC